MSKFFKSVMDIVQYLLMLVGITIVLMFVVPRIFGITPFIVLSGSMEPGIKTGSVAYADTHAKVEDAKVGDVIVFKLDKAFVTHRVVSINEDKTFTTKGDANQNNDLAPVRFSQFVGQTIFSIPYLGYLLRAVQTRTGIFLLLVGTGLYIVYFIFSPDDSKKNDELDDKEKLKNKNKKDKKKDEKEEDNK